MVVVEVVEGVEEEEEVAFHSLFLPFPLRPCPFNSALRASCQLYEVAPLSSQACHVAGGGC